MNKKELLKRATLWTILILPFGFLECYWDGSNTSFIKYLKDN